MSPEKLTQTVALENQFFNIAALALRDAWTDFILSRQAIQCTKATLTPYQNGKDNFCSSKFSGLDCLGNYTKL